MAKNESILISAGSSYWTPFKELYNTINDVILKKNAEAIPDLDNILRKYRPAFIKLIKNPAKNAVHRDAVKSASSVGLNVVGQPTKQVFSQQLIDESLLFSDMFELNELTSLELLISGEQQLSQFPGLTRGLVAVLLYYDGRRALVSALRTLLQARDGHVWTLGLSDELMNLVTLYTDQLIEENLVTTLLEQIKNIDIKKETETLYANRALGNPKHKKQVLDLMLEAKQALADCVFCIACQSEMSKADVMEMLEFLAKHAEVDADQKLDKVSMTVLMAILYSIDVSILQNVEDSDEAIQKFSLLKDGTFVESFHKELSISLTKWRFPALKSVIQLAWAVTLRSLSQYPYLHDIGQFIEEDENLIDSAVENNVFSFLRHSVISLQGFHSEEYYLKRIHTLLTDFLTLMPIKVKELRNRSDEVARIIMAHMQEGLEAPENLPAHFNELMLLIAKVYGEDPLGLELASEFWYSSEPVINTAISSSYSYGNPQKQVALYKFVRLSGDLLPPSLYIPHVKMLTSLAGASAHSAHMCFNLLKINGSTPDGKYSTVSWDHFFTALHRYHSNLHQETLVISDTQHIYRHRPPTKGITPHEMDGLLAILELTRVVIEKDEMARVALAENKQWVPVGVLLGLSACSIPPHMKGQLLHTLSAFAASSDIAESIWQSLEASQVIQTNKTTSIYQPGGIQVELDEIESSLEEYPLTRGMLTLLHSLTSSASICIPTLGIGSRAPGFDPYLTFIKNNVFLKFNSRGYKSSAEEWQVAEKCLEIFHKLLLDYEPSAEHFNDNVAELQGGGSTIANRQPGLNIMLNMLHSGNFLKKILFVTDKATILLDQYSDFPGKENLEKASLLCLKLIQLTLEKQSLFMKLHRESGCGIITTNMEKLLLGINPRTGFADNLLNIAKFMTYNAYLPEHALTAVSILIFACRVAVVQTQIVDIFKSDVDNTSANLLQGFVECINIDDIEVQDVDTVLGNQRNESEIRNSTRQNILKLLLTTLEQPSPNLAHFLLGFETNKPVHKTNLQDPGILGARQTCLHAILALLDNGLEVSNQYLPPAHKLLPIFTSQAYHLIYKLCVNKETSAPTLRYLRANHDFFFKHIHVVPFSANGPVDNIILSQQSWFLKSVAVELKVTSANRQRSHVSRLLNLLVDDKPAKSHNFTVDGNFDNDISVSNMSTIGISQTFTKQHFLGGQIRRRLLSILDNLDFKQEYISLNDWKYFDASMLDQVISSCEEKSLSGVTIVNIQDLHRILVSEVSQLQGAAALGQRPMIIEEIQAILKQVMKRNNAKEQIMAKKQAFEAWRQLTEIILTACPDDLLDGERRQNILFEIIQELLKKVMEDSSLTEFTNPVAGVILTLLRNLQQSFMTIGSYESDRMLNIGSSTFDSSFLSQKMSTHSVYSSFLQVTLKGLIECIMMTSGSQQRVRANFYAALLNYLRIGDDNKLVNSDKDDEKAMHLETSNEKLRKQNIEVILSYGSNFMEVVCRDTTGGHDICKMLALATIDVMCSIDKPQHWLNFMNSKGYIGHLVHSISMDDEELLSVLSPQPSSLRPLYIFESKLALLTRIACTQLGAQSLLQNGITKILSKCSIFDMRPIYNAQYFDQDEDSVIPSTVSRYSQILFPVLKLYVAFLTSLNNDEASTQVMSFLASHSKIFHEILSNKLFKPSTVLLKEKALLTAVLCRTASHGVGITSETSGSVNISVESAQFEHQMLQMLPYAMELCTKLNDSETDSKLLGLEILANTLAFFQKLITKSGSMMKNHRILFSPSFADANVAHTNSSSLNSTAITHGPPNLGLIISNLQVCMDRFLKVYDEHQGLVSKLKSLSDMSSDELCEFVEHKENLEKMSSQMKKLFARQKLNLLVGLRLQEIKLHSYMIESSIFLLWRHLEYFLIIDRGSQKSTVDGLLNSSMSNIRRLQDSSTVSDDNQIVLKERIGGSSMTAEELKRFKSDVANIGDGLFRKLHSIEQCYLRSQSRGEFFEAVLRRIKRLIQLYTH